MCVGYRKKKNLNGLFQKGVDILSKCLFCIIGKSGSGKTTICTKLEENGYKQIPSYTTRKPRTKNEVGHTFVTDEEFNRLEDLVAFADYRGARYGVTKQQVEDESNSLYVVDITGLNYLKEEYKGSRRIVSIYINADITTIYKRLVERYSDKPFDERTEIITRRLSDDLYEFRGANKLCDYIIYNDNAPVERAVEKIEQIIKEEESKNEED